MSLLVVPVAYGRPAHDELARQVAVAKEGDPLAPVTVVVPSNYVGVAARRALAAKGGVIGVTFLTPYRLAELLGSAALAAVGRRPVSNPVLLAAVQEELARDAGVFAPVRTHPATEEALVAAHKLLADLSEPARAALAGASQQASEVVRLHRQVKSRLTSGWFDEADLLVAARAQLEAGHPVGQGLGRVIVFLPQELSRLAARLLAAVAQRTEVVVLCGLTGVEEADAAVVRSVRWMGGEVPAAEAAAVAAAPGRALRVVTGSDADDEVRAAVRAVVDAARAGVPLERIALLHPPDDHVAALVRHHVAAAELPANGTVGERLADRVAGRTALALLALAASPVPRRHDVFGLLAGAPLRAPGGGLLPTAAWERLSREAGIVGLDRQEWTDRLTRFAISKQHEADAQAAADLESQAQRLRRQATQALALRDFVVQLLDRLDALAREVSWVGLAGTTATLLTELLGTERQRERWPEAERDAAAKVEAALERLAHLDTVAPNPGLARFHRTLELELDADLGRRGRFGEGLLVGPVSLAVGLDLDVVVIVGLAEGILPTRQRDDALLPDHDRAAAGDELPAAADRQRREHREVLAAVAAASREVVLTMPRGDLQRTTEHVASRWLRQLVAEHHDTTLFSDELLHHDAPWLTHVASFVAGVRAPAWPASEQEARLGVVLNGGDLPGDVAFQRARALLTARASPQLTVYDGYLRGVTVPSPATTDQVMSPTRLELWASCPYAYFVRYLLGVEPVENPEELLTLSALDAGTLVHRALEGYVAERLEGSPGAPPDFDALRRHFELACRDAEDRGVTGRPVLWHHRRDELWRHLVEFVRADAAWAQDSGATALATELRFGAPDAAVPPIEVPLGGGRRLRFQGSIDRVDRGRDGQLIVTDYKYSSTRKYKDLGPEQPTAGGTLLQLPIYALAAREAFDAGRLPLPVTARYAFARPDNGRIPNPKVIEVDDGVVRRWSEALATIASGIEAGLFPARPSEDLRFAGFVACPACDPDALGTADIARRWEAKQAAPELAAYVALIAGADDDD